ncbi:MAG: hypothetical protein ACXWKP_26025 [Bradyrhizobium sp.]
MSRNYQLSLLRRIERPLVESIKSLRQIHGRIVVAVERELRRLLGKEGSLIPIPVRTVVDQRRLDQRRSRD